MYLVAYGAGRLRDRGYNHACRCDVHGCAAVAWLSRARSMGGLLTLAERGLRGEVVAMHLGVFVAFTWS